MNCRKCDSWAVSQTVRKKPHPYDDRDAYFTVSRCNDCGHTMERFNSYADEKEIEDGE